jgi:HAD superfamily hydrolase (TIGR01490 family)
MDLALFDFDGTITIDPTYPAFVRFAVRPGRKFGGAIILAPLILAYRIGLLSDRWIRWAISRVAFWGDDPLRLRRVGADFAREVLPRVIRPEAVERIEWHKARGDRVVVVSAALDVYLQPWCEAVGIEVVCTRLEVNDGTVTGRYLFGDCCGAEKARRVRELCSVTDYADIYCYGDSEEDRQLLEMATRRYFRWIEVGAVPVASRTTRKGDYRVSPR